MKKAFLHGCLLAAMVVATGAQAALVNLGAPTGPDQSPNTWYTDRYAPSGWSYNEGTGVLKQTISADDRAFNRPVAYASSFYDTQGRKFDFGAGVTSVSIELYIPGDQLQQRYAGFWGTGVDAFSQVDSYGITEFATDGTGPRVQGWDDANGFINYGLPGGFGYDAWHELKMVLDTANDKWEYLFDGGLLGEVDAFGAVGISNVILQGYNKFQTDQGSYDIRWRNLATNLPESTVPEPGSLALVLGALGAVSLVRRKTSTVK